jgi:hypothetical protein
MTLKRHNRLGVAFVPYRAARAATAKRYFHGFFDFLILFGFMTMNRATQDNFLSDGTIDLSFSRSQE